MGDQVTTEQVEGDLYKRVLGDAFLVHGLDDVQQACCLPCVHAHELGLPEGHGIELQLDRLASGGTMGIVIEAQGVR